jgi:hypothetical protein
MNNQDVMNRPRKLIFGLAYVVTVILIGLVLVSFTIRRKLAAPYRKFVSHDAEFETSGAHGVTRPAFEELNWRRPLWEFFYPRVRHEDTPEAAAEIVARTLRERITVVPAKWNSATRPGIETIWRNQITNEKGFQRIYVATLRSVSVGARLNSDGNAEFWTGSEWKTAPRPLAFD